MLDEFNIAENNLKAQEDILKQYFCIQKYIQKKKKKKKMEKKAI